MITVETTIKAPIEKVWKCWSEPDHITKWCHASEDWHAPYAENDLRTNGKFRTTMASKDGSMQFDWEGIYSNVVKNEKIEYAMADGRKVNINFKPENNHVKVIESFDPEKENSEEMQRGGWQAILDNFKRYVEGSI